MSEFLTVDELIERIKEQNGTEVSLVYMDWMLRNGCFYRDAVSVEDIPRIMNALQQAGLIPNTDMKPVQPQISECKSQEVAPDELRRCEEAAERLLSFQKLLAHFKPKKATT